MRRTAAAILLFFFGALLPSATLVALAAPQQLLPICCRAHGMHACAMGSAVSSSTSPTLHQPACPYGALLHATSSVTIFAGETRSTGLQLLCIGMAAAGFSAIVPSRFPHGSAPRGPPASFSV